MLVTRNDTNPDTINLLFDVVTSRDFGVLEPLKYSYYKDNLEYLTKHVEIGFHQTAVEFFETNGIEVNGPDETRNILAEIHSQD